MKKFVFPSLFAVVASTLFFAYSCTDKNNPNDPNSIQGTFKEESTGTAANPNIGVVTVTGTSTLTNPATQNSAIQVAGSGWSYDGCATSLNTLTGHNGSTNVSLVFGSTPILGMSSYTLTSSSILNANQARLIVTNAPGQPDGIVWYSKGGTVSVVSTTANTTATFNNIQCLQYSFLFPVVTVSGALVCQ